MTIHKLNDKRDSYMKFSKFYYVSSLLNPLSKNKNGQTATTKIKNIEINEINERL